MDKNAVKQPFTTITIGGEDYKLKISASAAVETEARLKKSGLATSIVMSIEKVESITVQTIILHGALQKFQSGIDYSKAVELYEQYLDEGGSILEFAEKIQEIFAVSGFMTQKQVESAQKLMSKMNEQ